MGAAKLAAEKAEAERIANEKAAKLAAEKAEAERIANEKVTAEERIKKAREQPKSVEEEKELATRYSRMDLEERAFNILLDLGMIEINPDPDDPDYDDTDDDKLCNE